MALLGVMWTVLDAYFIYCTSIWEENWIWARISLRLHYSTFNLHQTVTKHITYHSFCCL